MNILRYIAGAKINPNEVGVPTVEAGSVLSGILNTVYYVGGIVAVIVIIVCGLLYTISEGDASKIQRAKNGILYSVVGLVVIFSAFIITNVIIGEF